MTFGKLADETGRASRGCIGRAKIGKFECGILTPTIHHDGKSAAASEKKQTIYAWLVVTVGLLVFSVVFLAATVYANWPAVVAELTYRPEATVSHFDRPLASPDAPAATPIVERPHIIIAKVGVDAPITWQVPVDKTIDYLNRGVAHLAGSATLGQRGNLFLTGHSSDYSWKNDPYAAVFALLPKLSAGDAVEIRENGRAWHYLVTGAKVVSPDDVTVTAPTDAAVVTLMTCYPIGTTRKRLIVQAVLDSPPTELAGTNQIGQTLPTIRFR